MASRRASNVWLALLALVISSFLWFLAHGASDIERRYDIPVVFHEIPDRLVITDQSADVVNIQLQGTRSMSLRRVFTSIVAGVLYRNKYGYR